MMRFINFADGRISQIWRVGYLATALCCWSSAAPAGDLLVVNSNDSSNTRDGSLGLTEAIEFVNGNLAFGSLDAGEQAQVTIGGTTGGDVIQFNIAGAGPHTIPLPDFAFGYLGDAGFPGLTANDVTIDGYSQPGSSPNTNSILQANNANLQIVVSAQTLTTPIEFDMFTIVGNNNVIRGISFVGDGFTAGADNFGVNFRDGALGGSVQGCWIGLAPDGTTVSGQEIGLGACETNGGHFFGTNGDGVDDRAEFNIICGHNVNTIVEVAADVKISGNFIGILADGLTAADNGAIGIGEGDANEGGALDGMIFGTDSDGVADADERNIVGGMADDVFQHYFDPNPGVIVAGNYFGVGVDGTTPIPNGTFIADQGDPYDSMRVGSDLDGVRDEIEANLIANNTGDFIQYDDDGAFNEIALVSFRANRMTNNAMGYGGLEHSAFARYLGTGDPGALAPVINAVNASQTTIRVVGTVPVTATHPDIDRMEVDVYIADSHPSPQGLTYLRTFVEGSVDDLDPTDGGFDFDIAAFSPTGFAVTVTANAVEAAGTATSQFSNISFVNAVPLSNEGWSLYE